MLRFEDLRVRDNQDLDRDFFNRRYRLIAESLSDLDAQLERVSGATDSLVELGLSRINEVLGPALTIVSAAAENGFLVATSATELTLTVGLQTTFEISDMPARSLFAPTPYVVVTRDGGAVDDWAVFRVDGYARDTGGLAGEVVAVSGAIGAAAYADWVISASAGLAKSLIEIAADVTAALSLAQQAASEAAAAVLAVQGGPVSSVNGQTGAVALGIGDIPTLTELLAGKAASTHGHTIAQVSNLQTTLDAKAATGHGHAIADITSLQTTLDAKAATGHGHAIADVAGLQVALDDASTPEASVAQVRALTDQLLMISTRRARTAIAPVAIPGNTNWTPDWSGFLTASWELTLDRTINNPTNVIPGTSRLALIKSSSSMPRQVSWGSYYKGELPEDQVTNTSPLFVSLYAEAATRIIVSFQQWAE